MNKYKFTCLLVIIFFSLYSCEKISFEEDGVLVPLTVMEDASIPFINVNGVKLHTETFGDPTDPMMIVIHGGPGADHKGILNFKQLASGALTYPAREGVVPQALWLWIIGAWNINEFNKTFVEFENGKGV